MVENINSRKEKKFTEIDCKEILEETVTEGEKVGMDLAERKGYSVETFFKCIRNYGVIDPKWKNPDINIIINNKHDDRKIQCHWN